MSRIARRIMAQLQAEHGPPPERFTFGDGIDWGSAVEEVMLYVELPFWLMISSGPIAVAWSGASFDVTVCPPWSEVFVAEFTDSRKTLAHQGPLTPKFVPSPELAAALETHPAPLMRRICKTVLRIRARGHADAFSELPDNALPREFAEHRAYWASLCEAHIPVVNELIQRYRLATYDYFAYEVSPWDVPIWNLKRHDAGFVAGVMPYKEFDVPPVKIIDAAGEDDPPKMESFRWCTLDDLTLAAADATPGELDVLDARSLMERGDYTGAVRRTVTAVEAVVAWALLNELEKLHSAEDAAAKLANTDNDFPGRLRQWRKLAAPTISQGEFDEFERTRAIRHDIVHRARRLLHDERGRAERAVDTGRWLFNKIEGKPERARIRDFGPAGSGVLRSFGRVAMVPRFPVHVDANGILLQPIPGITPQT